MGVGAGSESVMNVLARKGAGEGTGGRRERTYEQGECCAVVAVPGP